MARFDRMFSGQEEVKKAAPHPKRETKWIHYSKLIDNQAQYCNEKSRLETESLADLIDADHGVMQNLLVRKTGTDEYEIIAGHKRRRACKILAEERGKKEYEFLPCIVEHITDVQAEFQLYSSNRFHEKNDYEKMHELERMKYLLETYPEEFPHLQTGRMVERLAKQMNLKRTTVGEYLTMAKNLGEKGKEELKAGNLKKSAAVELAALPEEEQEELLSKGVISHKGIKEYKEEKREKEENQEPEQLEELEESEKAEELEEPEETQIAGQYRIVNTDMEMEEDVPKSGTQKEQYTPWYFLQEQKDKLAEMLSNQEKGAMLPEKTLERQKFIVCAIEFYVKKMTLE